LGQVRQRRRRPEQEDGARVVGEEARPLGRAAHLDDQRLVADGCALGDVVDAHVVDAQPVLVERFGPGDDAVEDERALAREVAERAFDGSAGDAANEHRTRIDGSTGGSSVPTGGVVSGRRRTGPCAAPEGRIPASSTRASAAGARRAREADTM
jgi:hypothetical protein